MNRFHQPNNPAAWVCLENGNTAPSPQSEARRQLVGLFFSQQKMTKLNL
jgi:hypothetical protein